jgi:hypothetical protein
MDDNDDALASRSLARRWAWQSFCAALAVVGLALVFLFRHATVFADMDAAVAAQSLAQSSGNACDTAAFYDRLNTLAPGQMIYHDFGWSLMLGGGALSFVGWLSTRLDVRGIRSPKSALAFAALAAGTAILWAITIGVDAILQTRRDVMPWCADSAGIPVSGAIGIAPIAAAVAASIVFALTPLFGNRPAALFGWDRERPIRSAVTSVIAFALVAILLFLAASAAADSTFVFVPTAILSCYIVLSIRAALVSPRNRARSQCR